MASPSRTRRRQTLRQLLRCPDCRSSSRLGAAPTGAELYAQIRHDPTCPWWLRHSAGGRHPRVRVRAVAVLTDVECP
ncbi:hypothetical protein K8W59_08920 [Nocardioides rotundus]|uniref:hypothetical protein n=1 Tax=Nocardioides rotundus TaxID=1774216 RepID=UPI001CBBDFDA|nr:hypothetical protein [Nocardioides rotundus]UAL31534.1 hypothetical protein K8W59_08920 [Nocardioides rotundus]